MTKVFVLFKVERDGDEKQKYSLPEKLWSVPGEHFQVSRKQYDLILQKTLKQLFLEVFWVQTPGEEILKWKPC